MTTSIPLQAVLYLVATESDDTTAALTCFAPGAVVIDEGHSYTGDGIREWREKTARDYTFTRDFRGLEPIDESHFLARYRVEGNFPGGVADLRFLFEMGPEGLVDRLEITA
jgi:hypothetical protein